MSAGRRFCVELPGAGPPAAGQRATLDREESRHVRTVLRLNDGDPLAVTDGRGHACEAVIRGGGKHAVVVEVVRVATETDEVATPQLHLACAVVKGKRFEFAVEKAVELGAHRLTPLLTLRGVIDPREGKQDRWRGLLQGALKQSGRCWLPELSEPTPLSAVLAAAAPGPVFFGAAPGDLVAEPPQLPMSLAAQAARRRLDGQTAPERLTLLIGPEGGWEADELRVLAECDAIPVWLGPHVLRTETAAVAGLTVLQLVRRAWQTGSS